MKQLDNNNCILNDNEGFTLFEVIAVLIIVGILSTVVANRISSTNPDLYTIESAFKTHIRYAQSKAMLNDDSVWGIRIEPASNEYWLFQCDVGDSCGWAVNMILPPGGEAVPYSLTDRIRTSLININLNQVSIGGSSKAKFSIVFNGMGVPFWLEGTNVSFLNPLSDTTGLTLAAADIAITIQDTNGNNKNITIAHETGFIQ